MMLKAFMALSIWDKILALLIPWSIDWNEVITDVMIENVNWPPIV